MSGVVIALFLLALANALSPVVLITPQNHQTLINSQQLLQYLATQPAPLLAQLGTITEADLTALKHSLKQLPIDKHRVSSFLTTADNLSQLKGGLAALQVESRVVQIEQVLSLLKEQSKPIVIIGDLVSPSSPRLLQGSTFSNNVTSKIFTNMSTASLSGLWVALFLLVMLGIAISCLFDLKTHDKFARQNLHVGRES